MIGRGAFLSTQISKRSTASNKWILTGRGRWSGSGFKFPILIADIWLVEILSWSFSLKEETFREVIVVPQPQSDSTPKLPFLLVANQNGVKCVAWAAYSISIFLHWRTFPPVSVHYNPSTRCVHSFYPLRCRLISLHQSWPEHTFELLKLHFWYPKMSRDKTETLVVMSDFDKAHLLKPKKAISYTLKTSRDSGNPYAPLKTWKPW